MGVPLKAIILQNNIKEKLFEHFYQFERKQEIIRKIKIYNIRISI
jgi:hypothetical protein